MMRELRRLRLFKGVDPELLERHAADARLLRVSRGRTIFRTGDRAGALYLLVSGRIGMLPPGATDGAPALELGPGGVFGELEAFTGGRHASGAVATADSRVIAVPRRGFRSLMRRSPELGYNFLSVVAGRLRDGSGWYGTLSDLEIAGARRRILRLESLVDAARLVNSSLNLRTLLTIILEAAVRLADAARGTLYLLDAATGELQSQVTSGAKHVGIRLAPGQGIAGHVARTGRTVNLTDAYRDPRFNPEVDKLSGFVTRSMLCMPLRGRNNRIIGVFQLLNNRDGRFDDDDRAFIEGLSDHAANAIENARQAEKMVQEGRLSVVGRMAGSIVHDIRNPLNMLRLSIELIGSKSADPDVRQILDMMSAQIDRFSSMAEEIIDFSRGTVSLKTSAIEPAELVDAVAAIYAEKMNARGVRLDRRVRFAGTFEGDFDKLLRLLQNLVGNALDVLPKGGTLGIAVERAGAMVKMTVSDDGPGIPDEIRARMFEPFETHGKKQGTGLGLAIVKKIAEDHRGSVRAESEPGRGTRMIVAIPASRDGR